MRETLLPLLPILEQVGSQAVPGTRPGVLEVPVAGRQVRVGDVICFELAWDRTVYDTARHRAQLVVVQSNNATYTGTAQPRQQFMMTRVRAMELRREVVVSTTSSFSGYFDARGRVLHSTEEGRAASTSYVVPLREGATPAVVMGPLLDALAAAAAAGGLIWALVRARGRAGRVQR